MAFRTDDFVKETSTVTGTGAITLGGARAPAQTFAAALANGDTFDYAISHDTLNEWEVGRGTYNSGANTITRSPTSSSNADALVNFSGGSKRVDLVLPASRIVSLAGPLFINAVSVSSGPVTFSNGNGVTFGVAGNIITASIDTGLTTNNAFQVISLSDVSAGLRSVITDWTNSSLSATRFVLPILTGGSTSVASGNVLWRMSLSTLVAAAHFRAVGGVGGAFDVQNISFANVNAVTFGIDTTTNGGDAGPLARITALVPRLRQVELFNLNATQQQSISLATDSTLSHTSAFTLYIPGIAAGGVNDQNFSSQNIFFKISSDSILGAVNVRFIGGTFTATNNIAQAQQLSFSDANGVSFGLNTVTTAALGRVVRVSASFSPILGVVSHVGGNAVSSVSLLAFSNASNVTFSLSTAANAATVFASVAAGGGGGITAFALSNAASSVMATGLTYSNANGFSFLLSTAAGNAATLSGSYTVPSVAGLISAFNLTNAASSVAATRLELSNANGFSFLLSTGASVGTLSASYLNNQIGVVSHIGGNVASSVTQLAFSNASNVTFSLSTAANAVTVIASVAAAGGLTYSGLTPFAEGVIVATTMPNNNFMVAPLGAMPAWQFDRVILGGSFSHASNSTCQNTLNVGYGLYTRNGSSLSLVHSNTTSYAFTGSGTVGNYSLFSNFRQFSIARTATMAASNYWVAVGWSLSTSSQAAMTAGLGMISQNFSVNIGFMNVSAPVSQQLDIGRGIVSSTTWQPPDAIAINAITGSGVTGWRAPFIQFASGSF